MELYTASGEKTEMGGYDGKNGVRCVRISPDGKHLASGDREGNIRYVIALGNVESKQIYRVLCSLFI